LVFLIAFAGKTGGDAVHDCLPARGALARGVCG
jgi:hypothetical protein